MKEKVDFTKGPILWPLINFTIPIFFSTLLQVLYGAVDLIIIGQFSNSANTSAVATGSQMVHMLLMIISGLTMGTTILLGQKIGAGKGEEGGSIVGNTICIYTLISGVLTFILTFLTPSLVKLLNSPPEAYEYTIDYIRISGYGMVFLIGYNVFGAIFRGIGDSKTPLFAVAIATILNIIGDLLLVAVFNFGASGAAIATVFAQAMSVLISIIVVRKRGLPFVFSKKHITLKKTLTSQLLKLGLPIAIQNGLIQASFLAITAIVNNLGVVISAGVGITERIIGFLMLSQIAFGQALATFSAHNTGAGKYDRSRRGLWYTITTSVCIAIGITWAAYFHGDVMLRIFTKDKDVLKVSAEYLKAYSFDALATSFLFCFVGYFNGLGKTKFTMWQGIFGAIAARIPLSYIFSKHIPVSLFLLGLAIPISTVAQNIICTIYFLILQKKIKVDMNTVDLAS